jgi:hypothetical protein
MAKRPQKEKAHFRDTVGAESIPGDEVREPQFSPSFGPRPPRQRQSIPGGSRLSEFVERLTFSIGLSALAVTGSTAT